MSVLACSLVNEHSNASEHSSPPLACCCHERGFPRFVDDVLHNLMLAYPFGRNRDSIRIWPTEHSNRSGVDQNLGIANLLQGARCGNTAQIGYRCCGSLVSAPYVNRGGTGSAEGIHNRAGGSARSEDRDGATRDRCPGLMGERSDQTIAIGIVAMQEPVGPIHTVAGPECSYGFARHIHNIGHVGFVGHRDREAAQAEDAHRLDCGRSTPFGNIEGHVGPVKPVRSEGSVVNGW